MRRITKLDNKSVGSLYAFFLAISAFLMGLAIACANIAERVLQGDNTAGAIVFLVLFNLLYGVLVGLISGLVGAIVGYISGYIFASLYNLAVKMRLLSGIKFELE